MVTPETAVRAIYPKLEGVKYMPLERAVWLARYFEKYAIRRVLEVGHFHGVSTCCFAAMVGPEGTVDTIDVPDARLMTPNLEKLARWTGMTDRITIHRAKQGSTDVLGAWMLGDKPAKFDFAYVDGNHRWTYTLADFWGCDKLLKSGGLMLVDDLQGPEPKWVWDKFIVGSKSYQLLEVATHTSNSGTATTCGLLLKL